MKDVMVDLETMGTGPSAAIVAIGACEFDVRGLGRQFYRAVTLQSSVNYGMQMDASTVEFWLKQDKKAQDALFQDPVSLNHALSDFSLWLNSGARVWGFGATFDNVILRSAYKLVDKKCPWHYRDDRCFRTLVSLSAEVEWSERLGTHHNALDDAMHQAKHAANIFAYMANGKL